MTDIALHATTRRQLAQLANHAPHGVLLYGEQGVGVDRAADKLARTWSAHVEVIRPGETGSIKIEQIRDLYETTRAKYTSTRVVRIEAAETMTHQAQNAFLKLLEEPGEHVRFILTTTRKDALLPTILSRVQQIFVRPLDDKASLKVLELHDITDTRKKQILFIANGLSEELTKLATDDSYFDEQVVLMRDARDMLNGSTYQRIAAAHKYSGDRMQARNILEAVSRILRRMLAAEHDDRLYGRLEKLLDTQERLEANGNPRLCLLAFVV